MALGPETETKGVNGKGTAQKRRADSVHPVRPGGRRAPLVGTLYFIQAGEGGPIKIGWTTHLETRLATLQTANPVDLEVLHSIAALPSFETAFQWDMRESRIRGEWFRPTEAVFRLIQQLREAFPE